MSKKFRTVWVWSSSLFTWEVHTLIELVHKLKLIKSHKHASVFYMLSVRLNVVKSRLSSFSRLISASNKSLSTDLGSDFLSSGNYHENMNHVMQMIFQWVTITGYISVPIFRR